MSALRKVLVVETPETWTPVVITNTAAVKPAEKVAPVARRGLFVNMALFLCAPFIGLLYAILLPFVGLGMLAWFGAKTLFEEPAVREVLRLGRKVLLIATSPLAGLAFVITLPFAGVGMLGWFGVRALMAPAFAT